MALRGSTSIHLGAGSGRRTAVGSRVEVGPGGQGGEDWRGGAQGFPLKSQDTPEGGHQKVFPHDYLLTHFPVLLDLRAELRFVLLFRRC